MALSPQKVKAFKAKAHSLNPVVIIADKGLTENVQNEIEAALNAHELIKIKIRHDREDRKVICDEICKLCNAEHIQSIGQILVIYRKNPDKK